MDKPKPQDKLEVLPEIRRRYTPHWEIRVSRERINTAEPSASLELYTATTFVCGTCGSSDVTLIHRSSIGSVAGGSHGYEFKCAACGHYTHYESEWG